jgi:hypothetical protein
MIGELEEGMLAAEINCCFQSWVVALLVRLVKGSVP